MKRPSKMLVLFREEDGSYRAIPAGVVEIEIQKNQKNATAHLELELEADELEGHQGAAGVWAIFNKRCCGVDGIVFVPRARMRKAHPEKATA